MCPVVKKKKERKAIPVKYVLLIFTILCALLIFVTNPLGSHAIAKGAYRAGIRPDKPMEIDDLGRDLGNE